MHGEGSGRIRWAHAFGDLFAVLALDRGDVVLALKIDPKLRAIAEVSAEAYRGVAGDRASSIEDIGDTARRNTNIEGEPIGAETTGSQFASQTPSWMCDRSRGSQP
jgi:hypothetical protein